MIEHVITNFIGRVNELTFRLNLYVLIFTGELELWQYPERVTVNG